MEHLAVIIRNNNPAMSQKEIAKMIGISKQRVSQILKKYKLTKICNNCFHYQGEYCSCRDAADVVMTPNKCTDWAPKT